MWSFLKLMVKKRIIYQLASDNKDIMQCGPFCFLFISTPPFLNGSFLLTESEVPNRNVHPLKRASAPRLPLPLSHTLLSLRLCFAGDQEPAQRAADGHSAGGGDGDVGRRHGGRPRQQRLGGLR